MIKIVGYVLLALVAYLGFMVAKFPASHVIDQLSRYVPALNVQTVEGTAFSGMAEGLDVRGTELQSLSWRWQPTALLRGQIAYAIDASDTGVELRGDAAIDSGRTLKVSALNGTLPLGKAMALAGRPGLPVTGTVELDLETVQIDDNGRPLAAVGEARLRDARTTLGRPLTLGDFAVDLTTADGAINGDVRDLQGPLTLSGKLSLQSDGRYRFVGQLGLRDDNDPVLRQALQLVGKPLADGRRQVVFNGKLQL